MGKKILWVSRHSPFGVKRQIETLQGMFGADCEVVHRDISNSREVAREYKDGGYTDLVCVVPQATLDHFCREGLTPLWAEMVQTQPSDGRGPDLVFSGKQFWFDRYRRVKGVSLELSSVEPRQGVKCVFRCTRHPASSSEFAAYREAFGQAVAAVEDTRPFRDGREVLERFQRARADELLVVAPYSVIDQLVRGGIKPLWAEFVDNRFVALHRVQGVRIDFQELA